MDSINANELSNIIKDTIPIDEINNEIERESTFQAESKTNNTNINNDNSLTDKTITEDEIIHSMSSDSSYPVVPKPEKLNTSSYVSKPIDVYSNLYPIKLVKNYILYQYAIKFNLENEHFSHSEKKKTVIRIAGEISLIYGVFFHTGDMLYATKEIKEYHEFQTTYNKSNISIKVTLTNEKIEMKKDMDYMALSYEKRDDIKTIFEIMIKDILYHNPTLSQLNLLYGCNDKKEEITATEEYNDITILPGYTTRILILDNKFYLNVNTATQITSSLNCLQIMDTYGYNYSKITPNQKNEILDYFRDTKVHIRSNNQTAFIENINFEKNPTNTQITIDGTTFSLLTYYKRKYNIELSPKAPLLMCKSKLEKKDTRLIPAEDCELLGLSEEKMNDIELTKKITSITKLNPSQKVDSINNIINLLLEKTHKKKQKTVNGKTETVELKSPYEKTKEYGLEFEDISNQTPFHGYIIKPPILLDGNGKNIENTFRPFIVNRSVPINYICLYYVKNSRDLQNFESLANAAKKGYGIKIGIQDKVQVNSDKFLDWKERIDSCYKNKKYNIIIILFNFQLQKKGLYDQLKAYTMETKGIKTQFVLTKSTSKNGMAIMSNILIQINSKVGGSSYKVQMNNDIKAMKLMIVGIDSSTQKIKGKRERMVSCCATTDNNFTQYNVKKISDDENNLKNFRFPVNVFIYQAIVNFFKINKGFPKGIIIYRQGISRGEKRYLSDEITELNKFLKGESEIDPNLKGMDIPYYYIMVNKKCNLKFFIKNEDARNNHELFANPNSGFLVCDNLTNSNNYEFYIQPQKVTQGTATPTCFHVAYGNLNCPDIIPKLTYELCFLYSNWKGPVRVPAPLKYAEKFAKCKFNMNPILENSVSFI